MSDGDSRQEVIWKNKVDQGFNLTDVALEVCLLQQEVSEFVDAWRRSPSTMGEELADIAMFTYGLAEMVGIDLDVHIDKKIEINRSRHYRSANGVLERVEGEPNICPVHGTDCIDVEDDLGNYCTFVVERD